jgi:hypothetical protein
VPLRLRLRREEVSAYGIECHRWLGFDDGVADSLLRQRIQPVRQPSPRLTAFHARELDRHVAAVTDAVDAFPGAVLKLEPPQWRAIRLRRQVHVEAVALLVQPARGFRIADCGVSKMVLPAVRGTCHAPGAAFGTPGAELLVPR